MAKLFDFVLTPAVAGTNELYYREETDRITFDTYFHGIPVRKLKRYTTIRELHVSGHVDFCTEQGILKSSVVRYAVSSPARCSALSASTFRRVPTPCPLYSSRQATMWIYPSFFS